VVDDVLGRGPLVAEDATLAVEARQVHVHHLGVVPHSNLRPTEIAVVSASKLAQEVAVGRWHNDAYAEAGS
jgi:hypothetical protein